MILYPTHIVIIIKLGHENSYRPDNGAAWIYDAVMYPKDEDEMANSVNPDQTAPFGAV